MSRPGGPVLPARITARSAAGRAPRRPSLPILGRLCRPLALTSHAREGGYFAMSKNDTVWFITGASTGFGRAFVEVLSKNGYRVVATARSLEAVETLAGTGRERILPLRLDVTDAGTIERAVQAAVERFGRIDVLVNNAGYGLFGALEEFGLDEVRSQFETNVFGLLAVTQAVLPQMRRQKSGHIVNVGSVGGVVARAGGGAYSATKFAVEALSEALAGEVEGFGIRVMVVEPGPFRTDFAGRSMRGAQRQLPEYEEPLRVVREWLAKLDGNQPGDPVKAVRLIVQAVEDPRPPLHLPIGRDARERIEAKFQAFQEGMDAWRERIDDTAF